ncbi:polyprenyl synthetase family protein [Candidatus Berkelbacteria bacterium]|nr:polyprenyl synthetase family protein [Candidatus Berkelbacteria bacterium]
MDQKLKTALEAATERVDPLLAAYLTKQTWPPTTRGDSPSLTGTVSHFILRGGKRLRPFLVYTGYQLLGGTQLANVDHLAAAVECLHAYFLIHDDIMDRSELRRNAPTVHTTYAAWARDRSIVNPDHVGTSFGILAGDLTQTYAFELARKVVAPPDVKDAIFDHLLKTTQQTIRGQVLDVSLSFQSPQSFADFEDVYALKTGFYSFANPLQLGALAAGSDEATLKMITDFALPAGVAFQITDDLLGLFGTPEQTGKDQGDLKEGKWTYVIFEALKRTSGADKATIERVFGNPAATPGAIDRALQVIDESGAREEARSEARKRTEQAKEQLAVFRVQNWHNPSIDILEELLAFILERSQ